MPLFHPDIWRQQIAATLFYWGLLPLLVLAPGLVIDHALAAGGLPTSVALMTAAVFLLVCGLGWITWATSDLQKRGGGTPSPLRPAKCLITGGSYRFCRHPMFLGYDLVLLGIILLIRSPGSLLVTYPLFLLWSVRWLRREERILVSRFHAAYALYQQEVPFLLPRLRFPTNK
jgi:protein-S-isoprenylcysteine O-methyltransferase Ste14